MWRLFAALGRSFERAYLTWARSHMSKHNPLHADLPDVVIRLRELEATDA